MISIFTRYVIVGFLVCAAIGGTRAVQAQTFGLELHNNLMPASGGMGGVDEPMGGPAWHPVRSDGFDCGPVMR